MFKRSICRRNTGKEETGREEIEETRVLAVETIKIRPIVRGLFANVKKSFTEACMTGFKTGLVTFFESLSNNIKKGSNKLH